MDKHKILIIEDEKPLLKMLNTMIELSGFQSIAVDNGIDALKILRSQTIAIMLLDIMMPGLNGLDILRIIRGDPKLQNIKVILLTAEAHNNEISDECFKLGCEGIFQKPADMKDIIAKLQELINQN